jgi:hypothetical protein
VASQALAPEPPVALANSAGTFAPVRACLRQTAGRAFHGFKSRLGRSRSMYSTASSVPMQVTAQKSFGCQIRSKISWRWRLPRCNLRWSWHCIQGQRQGDIRRLAWSAYDGRSITIQQEPARRLGRAAPVVRVPCTKALKTTLDKAQRRATAIDDRSSKRWPRDVDWSGGKGETAARGPPTKNCWQED